MAIKATFEQVLGLGSVNFLLQFLDKVELLLTPQESNLCAFNEMLEPSQKAFVSIFALQAFENNDWLLQVFEDVFEPLFSIFDLLNLLEDVIVSGHVKVHKHEE